MDRQQRTMLLKQLATRQGFSFVGVAHAEHMDDEARRLEEWLNQGYHGRMSYMENHFDKRVDPTKLVPGAKSVVSLMYNYHTERSQPEGSLKISKYAYGRDYHKVLGKKMRNLVESICTEIGEVEGRCFVDAAPVLERDWARRSGLGWIGKNTMLIHPKAGSYFFLAELIIDMELEADDAMRDYCGTCRRCIDACPTQAIDQNGYVMDGSKCISYLTIELKKAIPDHFAGAMENWIFGCDICQEVCPWNRFSTEHNEPQFEPKPEILQYSDREWQEITSEVFDRLFASSAVKRTKYEGFKRNIAFVKSSR